MTDTAQSTKPAMEKDLRSNSVWKAPFITITLGFLMARGSNVILGPTKSDIAHDLGVSISDVVGSRTATALLSAIIVIPSAMLITRLSPGALAWISVLLLALGKVIMGISPDIITFYVGALIGTIGSISLVPLFGQISRDMLSARTFVVAVTIVVVLGRAVQSGSLMLTGLVYEDIGWRIFYLGWGAIMIPVVFMARRFIKPTKPSVEADTVPKLLRGLGWLVRQPLVWLCGISYGLTMASVGNFGFIWNFNLQESLGWGTFDANFLTFMFVAGVIAGGYFVTLLSKWIGEYTSILSSMAVGVIVFFVCVFITSSLHKIWLASPMLFVVGSALGAGAMIQPHVSRFYETHMSALFFGVTTAIYLVFAGVTISVPAWVLNKDESWSTLDMRHALFPYVVMIAVGIVIFSFTRLASRRMEKHKNTA